MDAPSPSGQPPASFAYHVLLGTALIIGLVLLLMVLWYASQALLLSFGAVLIAILLRAVSDWVATHTGLSAAWALGAVLTGLLLVVVGIGVLAAPQVAEQASQLRERLPEAVGELHDFLEAQPWGQFLLGLVPAVDNEENGLGDLIWQATGFAFTAVQAFFGFFILLFISLYVAANPYLYSNGLLHLVPLPYRPRAAEVLGATGSVLRWWLIGTLIRQIAVGIITFVGLWLLDIPLALILALLAAVLEFVPYFGPIVAAVPAVLIAFTLGVEQGIYVLILYVFIQQLESLVISPVVYQRTVYLPPVLTILAQIILFAMAGALGVILATPLVAVALVWIKMLYVEQALGDYAIERPEDQLGPDSKPPLPGGREPPPNDSG